MTGASLAVVDRAGLLGGDLGRGQRANDALDAVLALDARQDDLIHRSSACWQAAALRALDAGIRFLLLPPPSALRIMSTPAILASSASAQDASTAWRPSMRTVVRIVAICRSPSPGGGQSLNGAPLRSAPGFLASTGTWVGDRGDLIAAEAAAMLADADPGSSTPQRWWHGIRQMRRDKRTRAFRSASNGATSY